MSTKLSSCLNSDRKPRKRAVQQRTIETQKKIIDAAISEFSQFGFDGVSTRNIAKRADVLHTLVTYHFKSKLGVWRAAVKYLFGAYINSLEQVIQNDTASDAGARLKLEQTHFIRFAAANPDFHRIMADVSSHPSEQLDWLVDYALKDVFAERTRLIREAQAVGKYIDGDPYYLEYLFLGATTRVFMLSAEVKLISGISTDSESFVDQHIRTCLSLFHRD